MVKKAGSGVTWYQKIFAAAYDPILAQAERRGLALWRQRLLGDLAGHILEVGAGTGINFAYYGAGASVVAIEPAAPMRQRALARLAQSSNVAKIEVLPAAWGDPAVAALVPPGGWDAIVCTLVLCTIPAPAAVIAAMKQQLAPGGQLIMLEHIRAQAPWGQFWQRFFNPCWQQVAEGCHLHRPTDATLRDQGFVPHQEQYFHLGLPFYAARGYFTPAAGSASVEETV